MSYGPDLTFVTLVALLGSCTYGKCHPTVCPQFPLDILKLLDPAARLPAHEPR